MNKNTSIHAKLLFIISLSFVFLTNLAQAGEKKHDKMFVMNQISLSLEHYEPYKTQVKNAIKILKKKQFEHSYYASAVSGGKIFWFTPISKYADMDAIKANGKKMYQSLTDQEKEVLDSLDAGVLSEQSSIVKLSQEYSYQVEGANDYHYFEGVTYRYKQGMKDKVKDMAKKFKAHYQAVGAKQPYRFYWHGFGNESRSFTIVSYGKNKLHHAELDKELNQAFKDDKAMQKLQSEVVNYIEVVDTFTGKNLTQLSYAVAAD